MLGAILGDICGSRFEWMNIKSKQFQLFKHQCRMTDDSIMTLAVAKALIMSAIPSGIHLDDLRNNTVAAMQELGRKYPNAGYGGRFYDWIFSEDPQPYNSWGNGAGMRVSPCAWAAGSMDEAFNFSDAVTGATHDHPEGLKGARAITAAVYLARAGKSKDEIREYITQHFYSLNFDLDQIRPGYRFDVSCQGSCPQAIEAFLEADGFEDAIRNAISIGGDSDTIAAMTGAIAEAFWGVPEDMRTRGLSFMDEEQKKIVAEFEEKYGRKIEA